MWTKISEKEVPRDGKIYAVVYKALTGANVDIHAVKYVSQLNSFIFCDLDLTHNGDSCTSERLSDAYSHWSTLPFNW